MQSRQLAAPYHLHSCRAAQQSAQLHDAHSNFKALLCAVPSVEGSKKAAISLLTYTQQTTGCTVPPNYHQRIVICKMSLAHAKPLHVSITATTNGCRKCLCCHQFLPSTQWVVALQRVVVQRAVHIQFLTAVLNHSRQLEPPLHHKPSSQLPTHLNSQLNFKNLGQPL